MDLRWSGIAYQVAAEAGKAGPKERRRWYAQNEWDAEHMRTESTAFPWTWTRSFASAAGRRM